MWSLSLSTGALPQSLRNARDLDTRALYMYTHGVQWAGQFGGPPRLSTFFSEEVRSSFQLTHVWSVDTVRRAVGGCGDCRVRPLLCGQRCDLKSHPADSILVG